MAPNTGLVPEHLNSNFSLNISGNLGEILFIINDK